MTFDEKRNQRIADIAWNYKMAARCFWAAVIAFIIFSLLIIEKFYVVSFWVALAGVALYVASRSFLRRMNKISRGE